MTVVTLELVLVVEALNLPAPKSAILGKKNSSMLKLNLLRATPCGEIDQRQHEIALSYLQRYESFLFL
ncbi:MAG: hypothetical protein ACI3YI_01475 [Bacteroidaceae bacterium]